MFRLFLKRFFTGMAYSFETTSAVVSLCEVKEFALEKSLPERDDVELMRTKHCLKYAFNMCKSPQKLFLVDDRGKKYKLHFDCKKCEMSVIDIV